MDSFWSVSSTEIPSLYLTTLPQALVVVRVRLFLCGFLPAIAGLLGGFPRRLDSFAKRGSRVVTRPTPHCLNVEGLPLWDGFKNPPEGLGRTSRPEVDGNIPLHRGAAGTPGVRETDPPPNCSGQINPPPRCQIKGPPTAGRGILFRLDKAAADLTERRKALCDGRGNCEPPEIFSGEANRRPNRENRHQLRSRTPRSKKRDRIHLRASKPTNRGLLWNVSSWCALALTFFPQNLLL